MVKKSRPGRQSSKKTLAKRLLRKRPVNQEHVHALKVLEQAMKYYDQSIQQLARSTAQWSVAQQKHKAMRYNGGLKKSSLHSLPPVYKKALLQKDKAKARASAAESALAKLIRLINALEKKEQARQKAVAAFMSRWERDYNDKHGIRPARDIFKSSISRS